MPEFSTLLAQVFTGLVLGMIYVLLAIGLSLIFGLMTVVNFAHGALFMLGAYFGVFLLTYTKSFWVALIVAPLMVGVIGLLMERFLIRRLYGRSPDDPLLLTFGLSLILVEGVKVFWGKIGLTLDPPRALAGAVDLGFMAFPAYRLFLIAIIVAVLVGLYLFLGRTNIGLIIRAGSRDPLMVRALGIDLGRVWLVVFGIGAALAGLAGSLVVVGYGIEPSIGLSWTLKALVVIILAGTGSVLGAFPAGLLLGLVEAISGVAFGAIYRETAGLVLFLLVLVLRPNGLFGRA